jgi:hypothetical protein
MNRIHRRLLGESLREIGVLVLVFVPLDMVLHDRTADQYVYSHSMFWLRWLPLTLWVELFFAVAGITLLYFGIKIEANATLEGREGDLRDDISDSDL